MKSDQLFILFLIICVVMPYVVKMKRMRLEAQGRMGANGAQVQDLMQRLDKIERRMANIETIVLSSEKQRDFERQL